MQNRILTIINSHPTWLRVVAVTLQVLLNSRLPVLLKLTLMSGLVSFYL